MLTPSPRSFVSVESPLPGGFEAADAETCAGASELDARHRGAEARRRKARALRCGTTGWSYFVDDLPAGISVASATWRGHTTPGDVRPTPPARAEEMYAPETFGRTAAETVVVTARSVTPRI